MAPFFFLISPQRRPKRWSYGPVRPGNTVICIVRCFQIGKRRTVRSGAFPGRTVPVFEFHTGFLPETEGGGISCNLAKIIAWTRSLIHSLQNTFMLCWMI
jgi:hypothetical protein